MNVTFIIKSIYSMGRIQKYIIQKGGHNTIKILYITSKNIVYLPPLILKKILIFQNDYIQDEMIIFSTLKINGYYLYS